METNLIIFFSKHFHIRFSCKTILSITKICSKITRITNPIQTNRTFTSKEISLNPNPLNSPSKTLFRITTFFKRAKGRAPRKTPVKKI